jgi:hypothetical protein
VRLFAGEALNTEVWLPHYLPHWSSREASAATWTVSDGELRLSIPPSQGLWCEGVHDGPLRVSGIQSASFSGPVGSPIGGQPFKDALLVSTEEPPFWGYTPLYGQISVRARAVLTARSMAAFWLSGIEDTPQHSGEICVFEVFGDAVREGSAEVGIGLHKFRDPGLSEDFSAIPLPLDIASFHTYGVDWAPGSLTFTVDGSVVRRIGQSPNYPVQLMLAVFDFPGKADPEATSVPTPELIVTEIHGSVAEIHGF